MEYNGASKPLFPKEIHSHSGCNRHKKVKSGLIRAQICVKPATTVRSAFFWQLIWTGCDEKQSTVSTSCHNTLSNRHFHHTVTKCRQSVCVTANVWASGSHLHNPCSAPWRAPLSPNIQQQLRQQDLSGMSSPESRSSSPISRLDVDLVTRAAGWWWWRWRRLCAPTVTPQWG